VPTNQTASTRLHERIRENFSLLREHVSEECHTELIGHTTLRTLWQSLAATGRSVAQTQADKHRAFYQIKWEMKDTIETFTAKFRKSFAELDGTAYAIPSTAAVDQLISHLPDVYRAPAFIAKHQNLPFSETINVMLSNISQVVTSGDNSSGQALYTERGRDPRRKGSSQYLRQPRSRGSRSSRGSRGSRRSPYSRDANVDRDIVCSWCNKTGHRQRDCWTL
jgi:hypothetical protein